MRKNVFISVLYTVVTGILLGIVYPLLMTGLAQAFFRNQANGQSIVRDGVVVGSRIIGQQFTGIQYFHGRPSAAGANGYDPTASGGSNYGPTNRKYIDRVKSDVAALQKENPAAPVPIDLVTTSGSGLDPDVTPAAAYFQVPRVAKARGVSKEKIKELVAKHTTLRQFGFLGEPRVNVLELNLDLDKISERTTSE
ncbi:MAG TPA: potassium-transporting ATPase subunit KdpC [Edaphobacter sp.]|jgi:K+-transporting ATPase ATPase C chain|nr:potassium-transporting ATPase subunit KdpC [Edaphobacter sp.]